MGLKLQHAWFWHRCLQRCKEIKYSGAVRNHHLNPTWFLEHICESQCVLVGANGILIKQQRTESGLGTLRVLVEVAAKLSRMKEPRGENKTKENKAKKAPQTNTSHSRWEYNLKFQDIQEKDILRKATNQWRDKCTLSEMKISRTTWKWHYHKYIWDHQRDKGNPNTHHSRMRNSQTKTVRNKHNFGYETNELEILKMKKKCCYEN